MLKKEKLLFSGNLQNIEREIFTKILNDVKKEFGLENISVKKKIHQNVYGVRYAFLIIAEPNKSLVLKVRIGENDNSFIDGFKRYKEIYNKSSCDVRLNLPKPFYEKNLEGICYSVEEYVDGKWLRYYLESRWNTFKEKKNKLQDCLNWLIMFKIYFDKKIIEKNALLSLLSQYKEFYNCTPGELSLLQIVEERLKEINNSELDFAIQHGDFTVENITVNKERFYICDWELTGNEMVPHHDFFIFLTTSIYSIERCFENEREKGFLSIFYKRRNRELFAEFINIYKKALNIDDKLFNLYFPLFLISIPVKAKIRGSSQKTILMARKNCELFGLKIQEVKQLMESLI